MCTKNRVIRLEKLLASGSLIQFVARGSLPDPGFDPLLIQLMIPALACFHGRIVDEPAAEMPASKVSSGGEVEHEVSAVSLAHLRAPLTSVMCRSISTAKSFSSSSSSSKNSSKGPITPNSSSSYCVRRSHWFNLIDTPSSCDKLFLSAAVQLNARPTGVYKGIPVYGLLTDLGMFEFWSYDPNIRQFLRVREMKVALNTREGLLQGMMKGGPC